MNKTYFAPTTIEVKFAGNAIICTTSPNSTIPEGDPSNPVDPSGSGMAPARKLYV